MALSLLTRRCGHCWEARDFSTPIDPRDTWRMLATLRYIHANPKVAGVRKGFHTLYSNYGQSERRARATAATGMSVTGGDVQAAQWGQGQRLGSEPVVRSA